MTLIKDPVLVVWRARNLLAEAQEFSDKVEISKMLTDTEEHLWRTLLALMQVKKVASPILSSTDIVLG
jgi:hypothetical protein